MDDYLVDTVRVEYDECDRTTDKAVCIRIRGRGVWLPLSTLMPGFTPEEGDGGGVVYVARTMAKDKGIV